MIAFLLLIKFSGTRYNKPLNHLLLLLLDIYILKGSNPPIA